MLEGNNDHTGLVLDGFVFDRKSLNRYDKDGFVEPFVNDAEHVSVFSPESVIRNCTFVNGSGGAVRISNAVTFENNIVVNVWGYGIKVTSGFGNRPVVIRDNTILFVFDKQFHDGSRSSGTGIEIGGSVSAIIEGNAIQYVDNFAIRVNSNVSDVALFNNSFFRNGTNFMWTAGMPPPTIDEKSMHLLSDLSFKQLSGNSVKDGIFQIDQKFYSSWFARTSTNRSHFSAEEWKAIAPSAVTGDPSKAKVGMALDWKSTAQLFPQMADMKGAKAKQLEKAGN